MLIGYRRDLGIGGSRSVTGSVAVSHEAPPDCGRTAVKGQDAPVELSGKVLFDPILESLATRLLPYLPRASNKFSHGLRSNEKVCWDLGLHPVEHGLVRSRFDGFADDIGVEKKGHQPSSAERPVDLSRSIGSSVSIRGEVRRKATNSAPVLARGAVSIGCNDWRMSSASCPSERSAPASALTRGASREGTVTSTRFAPVAATRLR